MLSEKKSAAAFHADFSALETTLQQEQEIKAVVITPERMIVELSLTPERVAYIEKQSGVRWAWFVPTYAVLKRHQLLPATNSWEDWLRLYRQKRKALGLKPERR